VTRRTLLRILLGATSLLVVAGIALFAWLKLAPRRVPPGQQPLAVFDASSFKAAFNAGEGSVRILALLSPT